MHKKAKKPMPKKKFVNLMKKLSITDIGKKDKEEEKNKTKDEK